MTKSKRTRLTEALGQLHGQVNEFGSRVRLLFEEPSTEADKTIPPPPDLDTALHWVREAHHANAEDAKEAVRKLFREHSSVQRILGRELRDVIVVGYSDEDECWIAYPLSTIGVSGWGESPTAAIEQMLLALWGAVSVSD